MEIVQKRAEWFLQMRLHMTHWNSQNMWNGTEASEVVFPSRAQSISSNQNQALSLKTRLQYSKKNKKKEKALIFKVQSRVVLDGHPAHVLRLKTGKDEKRKRLIAFNFLSVNKSIHLLMEGEENIKGLFFYWSEGVGWNYQQHPAKSQCVAVHLTPIGKKKQKKRKPKDFQEKDHFCLSNNYFFEKTKQNTSSDSSPIGVVCLGKKKTSKLLPDSHFLKEINNTRQDLIGFLVSVSDSVLLLCLCAIHLMSHVCLWHISLRVKMERGFGWSAKWVDRS